MADGKTTDDLFEKLDIIITSGGDRIDLLRDILDKLNDIKELLQP